MNNLLINIAEYFKNTYIKNKISIDADNFNTHILYSEIQHIYEHEQDNSLKKLTELTANQQHLFDDIYSSIPEEDHSNMMGSFVYINGEIFLAKDIDVLRIKNFYPNIIKFLYQNNKLSTTTGESYSFIIDNIDNLLNKLDTDTKKLLTIYPSIQQKILDMSE